MLGKKRLLSVLNRESGLQLLSRDVRYCKNYFGAPEMIKFCNFQLSSVPGSAILLYNDGTGFRAVYE